MRVLLLSTTTGYQTRMFREAAERAGIELGLATDRCMSLDDPWRDSAIPVRFHAADASLAAITTAARRRQFDGVLALGDRPTVLAAHAARALGLPGHPPDAAAICRNKLETRRTLRDAGLPSPWFTAVPLPFERLPEVPSFPCVIKPLVLSGSRGVIRADTHQQLQRAARRVAHLLRAREVRSLRDPAADLLMIEEYIPGDEYAIEALLDRGELHVLAVFDKPDPLEGPFFEETIYVTPSRAASERHAAMRSALHAAVKALGLWHGPLHAELRVHGDCVVVLEVAARPIGGLCARALRFDGPGGPLSLEDLLIRHAAGQLSASEWRPDGDGSAVMMIPIPRAGIYRGVRGLEEARALPDVTGIEITARPDQRLVPLPEGASYLGFIFARGAGPAATEAAVREAHRRLHFSIDRELAVVPG